MSAGQAPVFRPEGFTPHRSLTTQMNCGDTLSSGVEEPLAVSAQRLAEIKKSGDKSRPADSAEYFMNEMLQAGTCPQGRKSARIRGSAVRHSAAV